MNFAISTLAVMTVLLCFSATAKAEEAPATHCVTAGTTATHASKTALMEKDIAPYASQAKAAEAIKNYRTAMATAWDAMNEPYCGYGKYGIASSVKSYGKSVDRARIAFVAAVKALAKGKTSVIATTLTEPRLAKEKNEETEKVTTEHQNIPSGLHRGVRSASVLELQKTLATHFKVSLDSDWLTGYFGPVTQSLVLKFQIEKKIVTSAGSPGAGLVGPKTSAALNSL